MKPQPTFSVNVKLWLHSDTYIWAPSSWIQRTLKADSHTACRAHAVPLTVYNVSFPFNLHSAAVSDSHLPCYAHAASIPCSDHAVLLKVTAQYGRRETACGLLARVRLHPATTRSSTKIVIRSIPILLTTIHTYDCKEW
jgi:hypothetical protein